MQVELEVVCGPKFMTFWDDVGDLVVYTLDRLSFRRYRPFRLPLSCKVV